MLLISIAVGTELFGGVYLVLPTRGVSAFDARGEKKRGEAQPSSLQQKKKREMIVGIKIWRGEQ